MTNFIDEQLAKTGSILRGNRFKVTVFFPALISALKATKEISTFATSTTIPDKSLGTVEIPAYGGNVVKQPGDVTVPEWSLTMICDKDMLMYRSLLRWKEALVSTSTGLRTNDLVLLGGAEVSLLDGLNQTVQSWMLVKIFPTQIGEISLDKSSRDEFISFDCTFSVNDIITQLI